jgi:ATP-dependent Clp protease ATP-binding subunit ClpA
MFERYTEKARRAVFFARYEASQLGSRQIDAEHLLLGLLREDKGLAQALFHSPAAAIAAIRKEIEEYLGTDEMTSTSIDLPLSPGAKRALSLAAEESDKLQHRAIHTDHLLLGLIKEGQSMASKLLSEHGLTAEKVVAYINEKKELPQDLFEANEKELDEGKPGGIPGGIAGSVTGSFSSVPGSFSSFEELAAAITNQGGLAELKDGFNRLLDLLLQKGLITEEEKKELRQEKK